MNNLNIVKVSCCSANERADKDEIIKFLLKNPNIEVGACFMREKLELYSPRYNWIMSVVKELPSTGSGKLTLHVGGDWARDIVKTGKLPRAMANIVDKANYPIQVQLNIADRGRTYIEETDPNKFAKLISSNAEQNKARFTLQYYSTSAPFIEDLLKVTDNFDVLYDGSFGHGKQAAQYQSLFPNQLQGYAGGLSPDNIADELSKINALQTIRVPIWVDAEGKLSDEKRNTIDLDKAQKFIDNAFNWQATAQKTGKNSSNQPAKAQKTTEPPAR